MTYNLVDSSLLTVNNLQGNSNFWYEGSKSGLCFSPKPIIFFKKFIFEFKMFSFDKYGNSTLDKSLEFGKFDKSCLILINFLKHRS